MAGEQTAQPVLALALGQAQKRLLQGHCRCRVVAGALHIRHAVVIRFPFRVAAIALHEQLGAGLSAADQQFSTLPVADADRCRHHTQLGELAAADLLRGLTGGGMGNFVSENRRQLSFAV